MPKALETKKLLANHMKEMMAEKPFSKISVADICEVCQLNRKTFYYHFKDKYELVNWIYYDEFLKDAENKEFDSVWALLEELCRYLYENKDYYKNAFEIEGQDCFKDYFIAQLEPLLARQLEPIMKGRDGWEFHVPFFSYAILTSLNRWLFNFEQFPPEAYIKLVKAAIRDMSLIAET